MRLASSGHSSLVSAGVLPGTRRWRDGCAPLQYLRYWGGAGMPEQQGRWDDPYDIMPVDVFLPRFPFFFVAKL